MVLRRMGVDYKVRERNSVLWHCKRAKLIGSSKRFSGKQDHRIIPESTEFKPRR